MNARFFVPLIALSLAVAPACSKKKKRKRDSSSQPKKERPIVLDEAPASRTSSTPSSTAR